MHPNDISAQPDAIRKLRSGDIDPMQWLVADAARTFATEDAA